MPIHTVDEMVALKSQYTAKPFANFSLSNCIARKKQGERLERGAGAWGGRHAVTMTEARTRQIQHSLNKLSEEKYDEVLNELMKPEFFEPEAIKILVAGVFQKALAEPFLAALYANLCFSLARFEVSGPAGIIGSGSSSSIIGSQSIDSTTGSPEKSGLSANPSPMGSRTATPATLGGGGGVVGMGGIRPKSLFRATIVTYAQTEFEKEMKSTLPSPSNAGGNNNNASANASLSEEEREALRQEREEEAERALRRKRANIKFVGHLYLNNVLAFNVMKTIVNFILRLKDTPIFCPDELDLDVLTVLLTTIGARLDEGTEPESRSFLDEVINRLQTLDTNENKRYTMRVRTKVMNLIDLRNKHWQEKRNAIVAASPLGSTNPTPASIRPTGAGTPASPAANTLHGQSPAYGRNTTSRPNQRLGPASATATGDRRENSTESGSSSNVGSTTNRGTAGMQFPDTPSAAGAPNVSTPTTMSTPISFKNALMGGGSNKGSFPVVSASAGSGTINNNNNSSSNKSPNSQSKANHQDQMGIFGRTESPSPFSSGQKSNQTQNQRFGKPPQAPPPPFVKDAASKKNQQQEGKAASSTSTSSSSQLTSSNQVAASNNSNSNKDQSSSNNNNNATTTTATAAQSSSSNTQQQTAAAAPPPSRPIERLIQDVFREWLCSHSLVRSWQQRFAGYNKTEEELRAKIVTELIYEACLTTRADAQLEAVMFCKQGLSFGHFDFYPGFQMILRKALAEGVLTDVPKFFDRLMIAMHYAAIQQFNPNLSHTNNNSQFSQQANDSKNEQHTLGSSNPPNARTNRTGLFRQLAQLMFAVAESNPLDDESPEANEEVAEGLLRLWQAAPTDETVDDSVVDFILRPRACANKFPEMVVEMLTFGVHEAKVLPGEPVKKWLNSDDSKDSPLRKLLAENFTK